MCANGTAHTPHFLRKRYACFNRVATKAKLQPNNLPRTPFVCGHLTGDGAMGILVITVGVLAIYHVRRRRTHRRELNGILLRLCEKPAHVTGRRGLPGK